MQEIFIILILIWWCIIVCQSVVQNVWNEPVRSIIIRHVKVASFLCLYFEPVSR